MTSLTVQPTALQAGNSSQVMSDIPKELNKRSFLGPKENVYETFGFADGMEACSFAIVDLIESDEHFHAAEEESYIVVEGGPLQVSIDGVSQVLHPGQSIFIPRGAKHVAKSLTGSPVRLAVPCTPAWQLNDYHLANQKNPFLIPRDMTQKLTKLPVIDGELGSLAHRIGDKIIYEFVLSKHGLNFTAAIIDMPAEGVMRVDCQDCLHYTLIAGQLETSIENESRLLHTGDFLAVSKKQPHLFKASIGPARLLVVSVSQVDIQKLLNL